MKIAIVRPPTVTSQEAPGQDATPPLGVAYIAALLLETGHNVRVVDAVGEGIHQFRRVNGVPSALQHGLSETEIIASIPKDVDLIGVSCMFSLEWPFIRPLINGMRKQFPETPIVVGGEHITACPEFVLRDCPAINICVLGEGEETIAQLAEVLQTGGDLKTVEGLLYRQGDTFVHTPPRNRIRAIERLPRPAWHLVPIRAYLDNGIMFGVNIGRSMPMLASRGCPYQCTFCSNPTMWGNLWKARPPKDVLDEMMYYIQEHNATNFDFYDLTAIIRKDWIIEFAELIIQHKLNITWQLPSGTRSEVIDDQVTKLLYASGCRYMTYAPESGSEEVLKLIKKKIKKERMLASVRSAAKNGIRIKANFIFGFPGETYKYVLETFWYICQFALAGMHDAGVFHFSPYPGSELFNKLEKEGKVKLNDEFFYGLSLYTYSGIIRSYSEHISNKGLKLLTFLGMTMFYTVQYTVRPWRLVGLIYSVLRNRPRTKIATSLIRFVDRWRVRRSVVSGPAALTAAHN